MCRKRGHKILMNLANNLAAKFKHFHRVPPTISVFDVNTVNYFWQKCFDQRKTVMIESFGVLGFEAVSQTFWLWNLPKISRHSCKILNLNTKLVLNQNKSQIGKILAYVFKNHQNNIFFLILANFYNIMFPKELKPLLKFRLYIFHSAR